MRLLFDHNLSRKLVRRLADLFPDSSQTGKAISSRFHRRTGCAMAEA